jgi:hypothetical protein
LSSRRHRTNAWSHFTPTPRRRLIQTDSLQRKDAAVTQPTQKPVTDDAATPSVTLRDAALYLSRHAWIQGDYYGDSPDLAVFPAACVVGAIRIAVCGRPVPLVSRFDNSAPARQIGHAVLALAEYLGLTFDTDDDASVLTDALTGWNDSNDQTCSQVIADLNGAAATWDRFHGGAL